MRRAYTPRNTIPPKEVSVLSTELAPWRQGENAERSASLRRYYTTPRAVCQPLSCNFFRLFSLFLKKSAIPTIFHPKHRQKFLLVDIITKIRVKNWRFWIFTKSPSCAIIIEHGGNTCCACTVDHRLERSAKLMTPMRPRGLLLPCCLLFEAPSKDGLFCFYNYNDIFLQKYWKFKVFCAIILYCIILS